MKHASKQFIIKDWAGNDKSPYYGTFSSWDDAFDRLVQEFEHLSDENLEEQLNEFFIEEIE
jgi:hypothetical protein